MKIWVLVLILLIPTTFASAENEGLLNRLLAPGPLMLGHKDLEGSDCLKCHTAGKGLSEDKCMECHKPIKAEVDAKHGFHGLMTDSCTSCHSDHKGREYDSTIINPVTFDHSKTGYVLEGKHAKIRCSDCHHATRKDMVVRKTDIRYIGLQSKCVDCHRKDDVHHYKGKWAPFDCGKCHGLKTWHADLKFDHGKDAGYALEGKHAKLKCADCHKDSKYKWPELKQSHCLTCHKDFHKTNLGVKYQNGKCETCHSQDVWKLEKFNHKMTGYALRGKHAEIKCSECHKQSSPQKELKFFKFSGLRSDCLSCHKDYHRYGSHKMQRYGSLNQCLGCHTEAKWQETHDFNHSLHTRFVIEGKHIGLECAECHIPGGRKKARKTASIAKNAVGVYSWPALRTATCEICHDSPHKKDPSPIFKKKRCDECHIADGWNVFTRSSKNFDHSKTRFPLTGKHTSLTCSGCHVVGKTQVFHFDNSDKQFCIDCHKNQHIGQFHDKFSGQACSQCHSTSNFTERTPFNHDQTSFQLKNKHAEVKCQTCHTKTSDMFETKPPHPKSKFIFDDLKSKDCNSCHADYHKTQLGSQCSQCHNDTGWDKVKFDHNTQSRFKITGKHIDVKCSECHKPTKDSVVFGGKPRPVVLYKPISPECVSCHRDPHKGHFGNNCGECHMDKGWKLTKDFHKTFTLSGVHYSLQCQECHRDNRKLAGMSQECLLCHQKDDIHQGTLPKCGNCHKQQFWEDYDFKHSLTLFPLVGAHRTIACMDCHKGNVYQGLSTRCYDCHATDAAAQGTPHTTPAAVLGLINACTTCHNQYRW